MKYKEINRSNIEVLVKDFYSRVLLDKSISDFFISNLGSDMKSDLWKNHIKTLSDFWYKITLGEGSYRGNPFAEHLKLEGLKVQSFQSWLFLFFLSVDSIYSKDIALLFKEKSTMIAGNFMKNLGL
ncbi:MAG: globin [Arcobacter sp.]|nr:MAG: globin [Arcobacter sp.]